MSFFLSSEPTPLAKGLGYAGLVPFVLPAAFLWIAPINSRPWLTTALTAYAALIATFLGGIHWGMAAHRPQNARAFHYVWGVTPSLIAWLCLIVPAPAALPVLALLLCACYLVDRNSYKTSGWSAWLPMRLQLTTGAAGSCLIGAGAI